MLHDVHGLGSWPLYCHVVVPHITDTIQEWVERVAKIPVDKDGEQPQVCVIEVSLFKYSVSF